MRQGIFEAFFAAFAVLAVTPAALAQGGAQGAVSIDANAAGGVSDGVLIGSHVFFYSDNSSLGEDALKDGSATFTRFDVQYNAQRYFSGIGLFYEQDKFGGDETDTITGLTLELVAGSLFVKLMPGYIEQRFAERSFEKRSGTFMAYETGLRGNLYNAVLYYEVAIQRRTQTIAKEDGRAMIDAYQKTETMPILGLGVSL